MDIRKSILPFLLLFVHSVQAQFVSVNWSAGRTDSLLPVCTDVIDLPSDYDRYHYSAHVEYPEFEKMTAEEIRRYSIVEKYGKLPEFPDVECHVGVQAKKPQLDLAFVPVVMKNGEYYRIISYKLVVDRRAQSQKVKARSSSSGERYAASSVLASGKWVRVAVKENGVHKITDSELRRMGFNNPSKVRLYGYGGHILPEKSIENLVDDLCEVPLWRENGYVLFYANGTISWRYESSRFVHEQNVYSNYGCYFLTEGDGEPMEFAKAEVADRPSKEIDTYTDYLLHETEAKALCSYGRVLVDKYDFSRGRSMSYKFSAEGVVGGTGVVDLSFATDGSVQSSVTVEAGGNKVGTLNVTKAVSNELGKIASGRYTISSGLSDNPVIKLVHNTSNSSLTGFLDYIRLNFTRALALRGSQTEFRGTESGGNATFKIASSNTDTRVWSVADASDIKEVEGVLDGTVYSVVAPAGYNYNYVAVNVKGEFPKVEILGEVPNQDLHAMGQTDMVIIVPSNGKFIAAAEKLADAHRTMDNITVAVVTAQQVYNEFSSGTPDVTAYRRLMKMLYDRASGAEDAPKYLLLFGEGWYDNRLLTVPGRSQDDYLLCYESLNSVDAVRSYVLEDYAGFLDDNEGANYLRDKVDIGIGRIPAHTVQDANAVVDKTIEYMKNRNAGAWQNMVVLLGDDGDPKMPNQHMKDAENIASVMESYFPSYMVERIYWDDYPVEASATGNRYPVVTDAIYDRLEKGALIMNYSGHGSANLLSHEMVWKASDMAAVKSPRVPFWVTASCDIGPFDIGDNSVAESAILNPDGGAIGLFTTTRTVLQSYNAVINKEFSRHLLASVNGGDVKAVGDAVRLAKCGVISMGSDLSENKLQYVLLGDPALRLKTPEYRLVVDEFNGEDVSVTAQVAAGGMLRVKGYVADRNGNRVDGFAGVLSTTLFDCAEEVTTRDNTGIGSFNYTAFSKTLYSGSDSIVNGVFSVSIPVPMDISYSDAAGMLNMFAVDTSYACSAQGHYDNFIVSGTSSDMVNDGKGPEIKMYLNTPSFVDGDEVNATPCLWAELYDENGINTVGTGIGHDIMAIVDNSPEHTYNLNDAYTPVVGDYTRGTIMFPLKELVAGKHSLMLRAWDLYNNSSTATLSFFVEPSLAPDFVDLKLSPSPVVCGAPAKFILTHNRPLSEMDVTVDIFNFQGQILWSNTQRSYSDGFVCEYEWNGTAQGGQPLPTGVYLARAYISTGGSVSSTKTIKIFVLNNK